MTRQASFGRPTIDRARLRFSAGLLLAGFILFAGGTDFFHPGHEPANDHGAAFTEYAGSATWAAVHLAQFVSVALMVAGLLTFYGAIGVRVGGAGWLAQAGAVSAGTALVLYAVLQAVDGVALKQAVDAWVSGSDAEKATRFASAEALRWLEWGTRSYYSFMFGVSLVLLGGAAAVAARLPKALGSLMAVSGVPYLVQGWVLGAEGFVSMNTMAILVGYVLMLVWVVWLLVVALRMTEARNTSA